MTPLNIALIGYGKMGKEIEKVAMERGHQVVLTIDSEKEWNLKSEIFPRVDIALEFSIPDQAAANIRRCFAADVPVVTGTTGWLDAFEEIRTACVKEGKSLFYASNFSLSVNIFFEINKRLARMMNPYHEYDVNIEEIHHIHKLDAPSGTAIALANDIISNMERKEKWKPSLVKSNEEIGIKSVRQENVTGTHIVTYESPMDAIMIQHTAKNRRGFALGAVIAAEFLFNKKGVYTMSDLLSFD
ncbi:MAG: 4-hydroxy-tetrahydrodipicolinate reductase [Bacteroidetes bacterium]|nr:4-hydroxy-tetrahydrodipicolinate reductase [Bacteroidota bacterium]